jgi:hypothetical protein
MTFIMLVYRIIIQLCKNRFTRTPALRIHEVFNFRWIPSYYMLINGQPLMLKAF